MERVREVITLCLEAENNHVVPFELVGVQHIS